MFAIKGRQQSNTKRYDRDNTKPIENFIYVVEMV